MVYLTRMLLPQPGFEPVLNLGPTHFLPQSFHCSYNERIVMIFSVFLSKLSRESSACCFLLYANDGDLLVLMEKQDLIKDLSDQKEDINYLFNVVSVDEVARSNV